MNNYPTRRRQSHKLSPLCFSHHARLGGAHLFQAFSFSCFQRSTLVWCLFYPPNRECDWGACDWRHPWLFPPSSGLFRPAGCWLGSRAALRLMPVDDCFYPPETLREIMDTGRHTQQCTRMHKHTHKQTHKCEHFRHTHTHTLIQHTHQHLRTSDTHTYNAHTNKRTDYYVQIVFVLSVSRLGKTWWKRWRWKAL